jgi:hypothetical protein
MRSPPKRNARDASPGAPEDVCCADGDASSVTDSPDQRQRKPLIDRYGNRHAESVLSNWSPQILRILGVRRLEGGEP